MRIVDVKEFTLNTGEQRATAIMDFSAMTTGFVALVTDVVRDGKPVIGYGFSGTGRYSQNAICRERLIPRLLAAPLTRCSTMPATISIPSGSGTA